MDMNRSDLNNYKVVITTGNGSFIGLFPTYAKVNEFVSTVFDTSIEELVTVVICTTSEKGDI